METTFGISAAAPVGVAVAAPSGGGGDADAPAEEEATAFTVMLEKVEDTKSRIPVIKAIRKFSDLGLKEAKNLLEAAPKAVAEGLSKADAETCSNALKEAGGTVSIKPTE